MNFVSSRGKKCETIQGSILSKYENFSSYVRHYRPVSLRLRVRQIQHSITLHSLQGDNLSFEKHKYKSSAINMEYKDILVYTGCPLVHPIVEVMSSHTSSLVERTVNCMVTPVSALTASLERTNTSIPPRNTPETEQDKRIFSSV
jgi:hypothetical protein